MTTWRPSVEWRSSASDYGGPLGDLGRDRTGWTIQHDPWARGDPWEAGASGPSTDGWLTDTQMRGFTTTQVHATIPGPDGRWRGLHAGDTADLPGDPGIGRKTKENPLRSFWSLRLMGSARPMVRWAKQPDHTSERFRSGFVALVCHHTKGRLHCTMS